jgi:hypothetical protein
MVAQGTSISQARRAWPWERKERKCTKRGKIRSNTTPYKAPSRSRFDHSNSRIWKKAILPSPTLIFKNRLPEIFWFL